jgi:hypothetical protein
MMSFNFEQISKNKKEIEDKSIQSTSSFENIFFKYKEKTETKPLEDESFLFRKNLQNGDYVLMVHENEFLQLIEQKTMNKDHSGRNSQTGDMEMKLKKEKEFNESVRVRIQQNKEFLKETNLFLKEHPIKKIKLPKINFDGIYERRIPK